uniref:Homeobox domain-containing protein n=1 Tax=Caenorhabditis japonica TaxID=281687 RepID=A0A8R1ITE1_CAEJA
MPSHPKKAVEAMEHAFKAGLGNIGKEDRHRLAKETGLTPHQVRNSSSLALVNLLQHMFIANQVSARFNPNLYFFNLFLIMN